jgi:uncharacterized protein RhaS with RHS repeats
MAVNRTAPTTYTWDALDRLTAIGGNTRTPATYTYTGDGLRVRSVVGSTTTTFTWDLAQRVPQMLSDGSDHVWGPSGLIAAVTSTGCVT